MTDVSLTELSPGQDLWFGTVGQYGLVLDRVRDEHGFPSVYLVQMECGHVVALHEDKLVAAGVLDRRVH